MTLSFIGTGNMGGAILNAASSVIDAQDIMIADKNRLLADETGARLGCKVASSNTEAAAFGDYVIFCVKPHFMPAVLAETAPVLKERQKSRPAVIVSIAAGVTLSAIQSIVGEDIPIVRLMPNMPALIGKGTTVICGGSKVSRKQLDNLEAILKACGATLHLPENMLNQATVAVGSVPAFAYMFIEALADAGVHTGLTRADSLKLAVNAIIGAAHMVLEPGNSPGQLKDMVCSPMGSTIRGVASLEESAFRGSVIKAFLAAYERNAEMSV